MSEYTSFSGLFFIAFFTLFSLGEWLLSALWIPVYFRYGIPLFRQEYRLREMPDLPAQIPALELKLKRTLWRPAVVFRAFSPHEIAFRNYFGSRSRSQVQGLVRLDAGQGRMTITGYLPFLYLLLPLMLLVVVSFNLGVTFSLVIVGVMVLILALTTVKQRHSYGQIAEAITETAVIVEPATNSYSEPALYEPKSEPTETANYHPEFDAYKPDQTQSGLSNTEIVLFVVLAALLVIGAVAAFLLLG